MPVPTYSSNCREKSLLEEKQDEEEDGSNKSSISREKSPGFIDLNYPVPLDHDHNLCFTPAVEKNNKESLLEDDDDKVTAASPPTNRIFSCNYCRRKFYSSQALGGHQNAHKRERTIAKRAMRIGVLADRHVSLASLPLHGSSSPALTSSRPSIDIQAHHGSMMMMVHPHQHHHHQPTILPRQQQHASPFHDLRGGPAKFEGQSGYFVGSVPTVFGTVPFWPGSFRQVDDEAESSATTTNYYSDVNIISNIIDENNNVADHHLDFDKPDSCPDLTLKL